MIIFLDIAHARAEIAKLERDYLKNMFSTFRKMIISSF